MAKKDKVAEETPEKPEVTTETPDNEPKEAVQEIEVVAEEVPEEEKDELTLAREEIEKLKGELGESKDQYLRLMAEFDNFRKRSRKEMGTLREYASESLMKSLLPVIDDFARMISALEKTDNLASLKEGVTLVNDKLYRILEKEGLEVLESKGQPFDSELHDAIHSIPVEDEAQKGTVLDEVEKGYRLKEKVIRYSKVVVGE